MPDIINGDTVELNLNMAKALTWLTGNDTKNQEMLNCLRLAQEACQSAAPVLIIGEKGTGKSLLSQSIHYGSHLRDYTCIVVNCAEPAEESIEERLFGISYDFEETSFKDGAVGKAGNGTLIIENIDVLTHSTLSDILRMIDEKRYRLVGSGKAHPLMSRIVSTSSSDLADKSVGGYFPEDMIYGLGEVILRLPPLRERREDIPLLVDGAIRQANKQYGKKVDGISNIALEFLIEHPFPGNIRELRHFINRAVNATERDLIYVEDLGVVLDKADFDPHFNSDNTILPLFEMERRHIKKAILRCNGNKKAAARLLHITESSLNRRIKVYGLEGKSSTQP